MGYTPPPPPKQTDWALLYSRALSPQEIERKTKCIIDDNRVKCQHCGQHGEPNFSCPMCGAPIDPENE